MRGHMRTVLDVAPTGEVSGYDRQNLLTYAELLDAEASGLDWETGAVAILGFVAPFDHEVARRCWDTHLERARWIVGDGLAGAVKVFGLKSQS